jgi:hypothetical protein
MQSKKRVLVILLCLIGLNIASFGQATRSPFSSFGIGDRFENSLAHNQGMAGLGISNPQYWYLNNNNPALLIYNGYNTVLEAGFLGERRTVKGEGASEKNGGGNLNYLAMGIPIKPWKWSAAVGLMPYSSVNYQIGYTKNIVGSTNTVNVVETGTGGINQAYFSNGFRIYKDLTAGVKLMYLFSSVEREFRNVLSSTGQNVFIVPGVREINYYKDISFSGGLAYHIDSIGKKNNQLNFGATYDLKSNIRTEFSQQLRRYSASGSLSDSLTVDGAVGNTTLPQAFSGGISYGRPGRWTVGTDITYLDYSQFRNLRGDNENGIAVRRYAWVQRSRLIQLHSAIISTE